MTSPVPENEVHHLKEFLEEKSFKNKIPPILLLVFVLAVIVSAVIYSYYYRDLPKCSDESIQIQLNHQLRSNEQLLNNAQTLAFNHFAETAHDGVRRSCKTELLTSAGVFLVSYQVLDRSGAQGFLNRLFSKVDYSVELGAVTTNQK